jgi:hypothetical protein
MHKHFLLFIDMLVIEGYILLHERNKKKLVSSRQLCGQVAAMNDFIMGEIFLFILKRLL